MRTAPPIILSARPATSGTYRATSWRSRPADDARERAVQQDAHVRFPQALFLQLQRAALLPLRGRGEAPWDPAQPAAPSAGAARPADFWDFVALQPGVLPPPRAAHPRPAGARDRGRPDPLPPLRLRRVGLRPAPRRGERPLLQLPRRAPGLPCATCGGPLPTSSTCCPKLTTADWDHYFQLVQESDPYNHLRSVHNCRGFYDHAQAVGDALLVAASGTWASSPPGSSSMPSRWWSTSAATKATST